MRLGTIRIELDCLAATRFRLFQLAQGCQCRASIGKRLDRIRLELQDPVIAGDGLAVLAQIGVQDA